MEIPKTVQIGDHTYTVSKRKRARKRGTMAEVNYNTKTIELATHHSRMGYAFKTEDIDDSFWHECTHAILYEMGNELHNDEKFVTRFASMLTQLINSAKF